MEVDWKWSPIDGKNPPEGVRLIVKVADKNNRITYAIAIRENGKFRYTAKEDEEGTLPVYWVRLPE